MPGTIPFSLSHVLEDSVKHETQPENKNRSFRVLLGVQGDSCHSLVFCALSQDWGRAAAESSNMGGNPFSSPSLPLQTQSFAEQPPAPSSETQMQRAFLCCLPAAGSRTLGWGESGSMELRGGQKGLSGEQAGLHLGCSLLHLNLS